MTRRLLLALDTSFGPVSAALMTMDGELLGKASASDAAGQQAEVLPPLVSSLFSSSGASFAELGRVVASTGPGAFTGVRVGIAFAKGLKIATGCETIGISSLDCLAAQAHLRHPDVNVAIVIDARRSEAYVVARDPRGGHLVEPSLVGAGDVSRILASRAGSPLVCFGSGRGLAATSGAQFPEPDIVEVDPVVLGQVGLGLAAGTHPLVPAYLRAPDAKLPA